MTHRTSRAALTRLVLVGAVLCSTSTIAVQAQEPPPPGLGIRLLDAPTNRAKDPRARSYIVDRVAPGASFTRRFEVSNGDAEPMDVLLYPASAIVDKGSFSVNDRGVLGEVPQWASISPSSLRIPPRSRARASVTITVDPKATEGEYYGGIVAERPAARTGSGVSVDLRIALRVYLSVGPGGEPASDFSIDTLTAQRSASGQPLVVAQVKNTGGRALDMSGKLRLSNGPGGLAAGPFTASLGTTLGIGQSQPVTVALDPALPAGPWLARLELQSGLTRRAAQATITFPSMPNAAAAPVAAEDVPLVKDRKVLVPVTAALIAAAALLVAAASLVARRRRLASKPAQ